MKTDVVVIGGGYYGCATAAEIRAARPDLEVAVVEQENELFTHASSTNQGQLFAGYMYSKFPELAHECAAGVKVFAHDYGEAINKDVLTYYGVHRDSEITPAEYEAFCARVGLPLQRIVDPSSDLFGDALTRVYETSEKTFDNAKLQRIMKAQLAARDVQLIKSFAASKVRTTKQGLEIVSGSGQTIKARAIFNATFAGSNKLHENSDIPKLPLDHAVFLHFLIDLPGQYVNKGLIVVRGMYAALTPASSQTSASHVLASGKFRIIRASHIDAPSELIDEQEVRLRYEQAIAEAAAYIPVLRLAKLRGHTIGTRTNYIDPLTGVSASRAVVLRDYAGMRGYHCVFGGKVACLPEIKKPVRHIVQNMEA